jgi:hypothetical protein
VAGCAAWRFGDVAANVALESEPARGFAIEVLRLTPLVFAFFFWLADLLELLLESLLESLSDSLLEEESLLLVEASAIASSEEEASLEEELLSAFVFLTFFFGAGEESLVFLLFGSSSSDEDVEEPESESDELDDELEEDAGAFRFKVLDGTPFGFAGSLASESESDELDAELELELEELESDGGALRFKLLGSTFLALILFFLVSSSLASESASELELEDVLDSVSLAELLVLHSSSLSSACTFFNPFFVFDLPSPFSSPTASLAWESISGSDVVSGCFSCQSLKISTIVGYSRPASLHEHGVVTSPMLSRFCVSRFKLCADFP